LSNLFLVVFQVETPSKLLIVEDFSLKIERGSPLLISGPSGVGKTSMARAMHGEEKKENFVWGVHLKIF